MHRLVIKFFYFFLLVSVFLFSAEKGSPLESKDSSSISATDGLPNNLINQSVCAISGAYVETSVDMVIPGPEPLIITRSYVSQDHRGNFGAFWTLNVQDVLTHGVMTRLGEAVHCFELIQRSGSRVSYYNPLPDKKHKYSSVYYKLQFPKGITNASSREISGKTNIRNQKAHCVPKDEAIYIISGAGDVKTFKRLSYKPTEDEPVLFQQVSEKRTNGNGILYEIHDKEGPFGYSLMKAGNFKTKKIFNWIKFEKKAEKIKEDPYFYLTASDGRSLKYKFFLHKYKIKEKDKWSKSVDEFEAIYLSEVHRTEYPEEKYEYQKKSKDINAFHVVKKSFPEGRYLATEYYQYGRNQFEYGVVDINDSKDFRLDRVKCQKAPVGTDGTPIITHQFIYNANTKQKKDGPLEILDGTTEVFDAYFHRSIYAYDKNHRLQSISKYKGKPEKYSLYKTEVFIWGPEGGQSEGDLFGKYLKDGNGKIHSARYFVYDDHGNIINDHLFGSLTGRNSTEVVLNKQQVPMANGCEGHSKIYTYSQDGLNLKLSETEGNGKITHYEYQPGTDILSRKLISQPGQVQLREFYFYDQNAVLVKKVADNGVGLFLDDLTGVTERHFTYITPKNSAPLGLPEIIEEKYFDFGKNQEVSLKRTVYTYSPLGYVLKQDVYDAEGKYTYSLTWEYDAHGNAIKETNALGYEIIRSYDANNNLIDEQGPCLDYRTHFVYDFSNRLIRQEEIHTNGQRFVTSHKYDYLGNRIATTNPYGHETNYTYDEFGRLINTQQPFVANESGQLFRPEISQEYDVAGNLICLTDLKGNKTYKEYNIRGQPLRIMYADGTQEQFFYELHGALSQKIDKNGLTTFYTRDYQGRILKEEKYSPSMQLLKSESNTYDALHLISSTDAEGLTTNYHYDQAGRLIVVFKGDQAKLQIYDSLGRIKELREWYGPNLNDYTAHFKVYDLLNRVIEERLEESTGEILSQIHYQYDHLGNQTLVQKENAITKMEYNSLSKPIKMTDALGNVTHFTYNYEFLNGYNQRVLQVIATDPLGYKTIQSFDTANRLSEEIRKNSMGVEIAHKEVNYDACGNIGKVTERVMAGDKVQRVIYTLWQYNSMNQLTMLVEAAWAPEQKVTRHAYDSFGQKVAVTKPDGIILLYDYDLLGRLTSFKASDTSFAYQYEYNLSDLPVRITNVKSNYVNERSYDSIGRLKTEKLGNGLSLNYGYDRLGRMTTFILPDQSQVEYVYNGADLKEIRRLANGKVIYSHCNTKHNLSGQIKESQLIGTGGKVSYDYDLLGRCISMASKFYNQTIPVGGYDSIGNLLKYVVNGSQTYDFAYDDYYQLSNEKSFVEHSYKCDSLSNRLDKDGQVCEVNCLNQLLKQGIEQYEFDQNGNMTKRIKGSETTSYGYDALGRLTSVNSPEGQMTYVYDSFNRRIMKKRKGLVDQLYIYQNQEEVGMWENGVLAEFKVLGKGRVSQVVAFEIKGNVYIPVQDLFRNTVCVADMKGNIVEKYQYSAFGEERILDKENNLLKSSRVGNPWRYANKRKDAETGFVAFGLRYYEPSLGRWVTPDPIGYEDGPNLYAYVHHSPLIYYDEFGLSAETFSDQKYPKINHVDFESDYRPKEDLGLDNDTYFNSWSLDPVEKVKPPVFNEFTASYNLNNGFLDPKTNKPFQLIDRLDKKVTFCNGINNQFKDFSDSLIYLGSMSLGHNIYGVHSASFGVIRDSICYFRSLFNYEGFEAVREMHKEWNSFFKNAPVWAILLHVCHSRGAVYTRNALMSYPPELRKRIMVIAISPGGYVDEGLCYHVTHYASEKDIVPYLDLKGRSFNTKNLVILKAHPGAKGLDHEFTSLTFKTALKNILKSYFEYERQNL